MSTLWLLEDQLSVELVRKHRPDRVLLIESKRHVATWPFHQHRILFQVSAIRHFAEELESGGIVVHHNGLGRRPYLDSLAAIAHLVKETRDPEMVVVDPSEFHCARWIKSIAGIKGVRIRHEPNTLFLTDRAEFAAWSRPLKKPVMEPFYRRMRAKLNVLVESDGSPVGGEWNLDKENRKPAKRGMTFPEPFSIAPDAITRCAMKDVDKVFSSHPGSTREFSLPVTRADAEKAWARFAQQRLPQFGDYEDAMLTGLSPQAMNDWFYSMHVDSVDWVVTPNALGMGMNADNGTMATKPYVSSAAYINRMSDYCADCTFEPAERVGESACPFNYLFWTFLHEGAGRFKSNRRMTMMLKNAEKMDANQMSQMMKKRTRFIELHICGKVSR